MTNQNKPDRKLLIGTSTNPGVLMWAKVTGEGQTKMEGDPNNPQDKEYSAEILVTPEVAKPIIEQIKAFYNAEADNPTKYPVDGPKFYKCWKEVVDKDGNPTGLISFKAKTKAVFKDGNVNKVKIYDSQNQVMNNFDKLIGNESTGCLSTRMFCWTNAGQYGVSLGLTAVKLIKFVEYSDDPGFDNDAVSGGYVAEEAAEGSEEFGKKPAQAGNLDL